MILHEHELTDLRQELEGASVALRFGVYDILHADHRKGLQYAAAQADILMVGVMPDAYVTKTKGPERPLNPDFRRAAAIDASDSVDYSFVAPTGVLGLARVVRALRPDVYVEGSEHGQNLRPLKTGFLRLLGVEYVVDGREHVESTSQIIARLGVKEALERSSFDFRLEETA